MSLRLFARLASSAAVALLLLAASPLLAAPPPLPVTPSPTRLLVARPFLLEQALPVPGRPDLPPSTQGWLVVVQADPAACWPRQTSEPVLYAGAARASRQNHGSPEGHVVALLVGAQDLAKEPIWFGEPALPEQIRREQVIEQRALAEAAGIRPPGARELELALERGGERVVALSFADLWPAVSELIHAYDPQRAASLREPEGREAR